MKEMIKRKGGSYSQRGLWDNIRANKGSGRKPTAQMLRQEKKIKAKMQNGAVSTDIPVRRLKSKVTQVSSSGYYKTIEKEKLTPREQSSSSTVRRTARGLLKGAPRATNIMPNPGEINNMPNPKEIESPYLKTSMKNGGMTPANKAAMKLAKNMKGKIVGSDRMLKKGGMTSRLKQAYINKLNKSK